MVDPAETPPAAGNITLLDKTFTVAVAGLNNLGTVWILGLMVLITLDVGARYLLNAPINGVTELVELSIVGIVFLQLGAAVRAGRITRSDGLYSKLLTVRPGVGHALGFAFDLSGALFAGLILYGGVPRLIEAYQRGYFAGNEGLFVFPLWPVRLILVVGCVVVALQFLIFAWHHVVALNGKDTRG